MHEPKGGVYLQDSPRLLTALQIAVKCDIKRNLLVVDPGRSQRLLELGEAHDVNVDELNYFVTLSRATGLVPHDLPHDPGGKRLVSASSPNIIYTFIITKPHSHCRPDRLFKPLLKRMM